MKYTNREIIRCNSYLDSHLVLRFERNATVSPLVSLPGEVRNIIYFYLSDSIEVTLRCASGRHDLIRYPRNLGAANQNLRRLFMLPRVCRQLYSDLSQFLYRRVSIDVRKYAIDPPGYWSGMYQLLPGQRYAIEELHITEVYPNWLRPSIVERHFDALKRVTVACKLWYERKNHDFAIEGLRELGVEVVLLDTCKDHAER